MSDSAKTVHDLFHISDDHVALQWSHASEYDPGLPHTNVVMAAYTTAAARLKLYELLERLQERVIYFDTDSVVYVHKEDGSYNPPLSNYLGGLKDEYPNDQITEFVALGPKNYALKTASGDTTCKVRGFSLNYRTAQLINFDSLTKMVSTGQSDREIVTEEPHGIRRDGSGALYTTRMSKRYKMVYSKRLLLDDGVRTVPFGWLGPAP